jgi:hypothetical protein
VVVLTRLCESIKEIALTTFGFSLHIFPFALQECVVKYCTLPFCSSFYLELIRIKYVDMLAGFIAMVTKQYIRYLIYSNACKIKKKIHQFCNLFSNALSFTIFLLSFACLFIQIEFIFFAIVFCTSPEGKLFEFNLYCILCF